MTDLFNEKAKDWDSNDLVLQLSRAIGKAIREHIALSQDLDVMDFGAGTGLISAQLAPHVRGILAVDTSKAMLDKLAAKSELENRIQTVCQDITAKPLNKQFDLIVSAMAMHHVEDTDKLFQRFAEHLKPGGHIAVADLDKEDGSFHPEEAQGVFHHGFEQDQLARLAEKHGFTDIRFHRAHTVRKEDGGEYPVFLLTARRQ